MLSGVDEAQLAVISQGVSERHCSAALDRPSVAPSGGVVWLNLLSSDLSDVGPVLRQFKVRFAAFADPLRLIYRRECTRGQVRQHLWGRQARIVAGRASLRAIRRTPHQVRRRGPGTTYLLLGTSEHDASQ